MKHHVATLLDKEMDRKDFLKYMAVAGFMMFGGGAVLRTLGDFSAVPSQRASKKTTAYGFGSGRYGV